MRWQQTPPEAIGYYWWKRLKSNGEPEIAKITKDGMAEFAAWGTSSIPERLKGWWWPDPIVLPTEAE